MVRAHSADRSQTALQTGLALTLALVCGVIWIYRPLLARLIETWTSNREYSHGFLVPVFAGIVLWSRRSLIPGSFSTPFSRSALTCGIGLIFCGGVLRALAVYMRMMPVEAGSLLPCLAGVVLLCGGWPALRWAAPAIGFLVFMIPLPQAIAGSMSATLQSIATDASTFALQTLGIPAVAHGNVIALSTATIGVAEACNGLSMLYAFFALSTGACLLLDRPLWEKLVVGASAVVIAILANILRITATGVAFEFGDPELAERIFHDLAGWLMMPFGVGCLLIELVLLSHLLVEDRSESVLKFAMKAN